MSKVVKFDGSSSKILAQYLAEWHPASISENGEEHFLLNKHLSENELITLCNFCKENSQSLPWTRLSLQIDAALLKNPIFIDFIKTLNATYLIGLDLSFSKETLEKEAENVCDFLTQCIAPHVYFPISINQIEDQGNIYTKRYHTEKLKKFQETIINNIHHKQERLFTQDVNPLAPQKEEYYKEKNKLKKLIRKQNNQHNIDNSYNRHLTIEMQHTEVVERKINLEEEHRVQATLEERQEAFITYHDTLVTYADFVNIPS